MQFSQKINTKLSLKEKKKERITTHAHKHKHKHKHKHFKKKQKKGQKTTTFFPKFQICSHFVGFLFLFFCVHERNVQHQKKKLFVHMGCFGQC